MKRFSMAIMLLIFLMPAAMAAENGTEIPQEMSGIQKILSKYEAEGYKILGPVQYLGKNLKHIELYRHRPVSYGKLEVKDATGIDYFVKKHEFVYVLKKDDHVILIRIDREGEDNA